MVGIHYPCTGGYVNGERWRRHYLAYIHGPFAGGDIYIIQSSMILDE
jgi:hypothetical protein